MDDFELAVAGEGLGVGGESGGVPPVVSSELTGQVRGGLAGEGAQPLGAVGSVPAIANKDSHFRNKSLNPHKNHKTDVSSNHNPLRHWRNACNREEESAAT